MKSPMNQAITVTLVVLFASALTLTVALISLFYINQHTAKNPALTTPINDGNTLPAPSLSSDSEETSTLPILITTPKEEEPTVP